MSKLEYLKRLNEILIEKGVNRDEAAQVLSDYEDLYDQALERSLTEEEIVSKLGDPKFVYRSLKPDLKHGNQSEFGNKITGVMVFISIALFFVVGMVFDKYQYSWLFFLLIPITGILTSVKGRELLPALSVFISLIVYYLIGVEFGLWHPGWLVFLSIPISGVIISIGKDKKSWFGLLPFVVTIVYFIISYNYNSFYTTGWPIFFLVPIVGSLFIEKLWVRYTMFLSLILAVLVYYLVLHYTNTNYGLLAFVVPIVLAVVTGVVKLTFETNDKLGQNIVIAILTIIAVYALVSAVTRGWEWTWLILLAIPMVAIYLSNGFKNITAFSPFVAIILFYLVGYIIPGGFQYSWLFFLLVPISGILFEGEKAIDIKKHEEEVEKLID